MLRPQGDPAYAPAPGCVPGGGCGTVTATYGAVHAGRVTVTANRTSCGEALRCSPEQGSFTVAVVVSG